MDALIKLKIKLDYITGKISAFCMRKPIRFALITFQWLVLAFILFTFYFVGFGTDTPLVISVIFAGVLSKWLTRKKPHVEGKGPVARPTTEAGMTGICEKCGTNVSINYGDAYHTLCEKCT